MDKVVPPKLKPESSLDRKCPVRPSEKVSPVLLETPSTLLDNPQPPKQEPNPPLEAKTTKEPKDEITVSEAPLTSPVEPSLTVSEPPSKTEEPLPNKDHLAIEEISEVTEPIQENIASSPEPINFLEDKNLDINVSITEDNFTTPKAKENPVKAFSSSLYEEIPIRDIFSTEKPGIKLSETYPIPQPDNTTSTEISCLLIVSPKPIITPAIISSPSLLMSPSLFGEEHLFKTHFKNTVLDFLLPSPVNSTPSDNPFKRPEEPVPMEEDCSNLYSDD